MSVAELVARWSEWMVAASLQGALVAAAVLAADLVLRRFAWPRLRAALHALALVKLLVPPGLALVALPVLPALTGFLARPTAGILAENGTAAPAAGALPAWSTALFVLWCAGVVVVAGGAWRRDRRARRALRRASVAAAAPLQALAERWARRLGLRQAPAVLVSADLPSPLVVDGRAPFIVVPASLLVGDAAAEIEPILVHELMHLRRRDALRARAAWLVAALFWFHPIAWLLVRRLAALRELGCDADVAAQFAADDGRGDALVRYRAALLHAAARRFGEPLRPRLATPLLLQWSGGATLLARLEWLARPRRSRPRVEALGTTAIVFVLALVALPTATAERDAGRRRDMAAELAPLFASARSTADAAASGRPVAGCLSLHYSIQALAADAARADVR